jgi:hypothetical protein
MLVDTPEVQRRLQSLQPLGLASLPSWSGTAWAVSLALLLAAATAGGISAWTETHADRWFVFIGLTSAMTLLQLVIGVSAVRVLLTGNLAGLRAWRGTAGADDSVSPVLGFVVGAVTLDAGGMLAPFVDVGRGRWAAGRARRRLATAPAQVADCLGTDERTFATVVGTVYPRGWRSATILLTLGLAGLYWRWRRHVVGGVLAVTDSRVLFRGSRSGELLVDQPLGTVRVDRWGTGSVQKRFTMRVRLSDGTGLRFVAPTGEDTRALTRAALVLASTSPKPPRVLARYWALSGIA